MSSEAAKVTVLRHVEEVAALKMAAEEAVSGCLTDVENLQFKHTQVCC